MGDGAYSFSLTTFSPTGKLLQIEHALNAVNKRGKTSLGIRATNGVVLATSKKVPALVDLNNFQKVNNVTDGIGMVYAGMGPDFRLLLKRARKQAQTYYRQYLDQVPTEQLTRMTAQIMQEFTQQGGVRPFGVSLLIAGYDDDGPQLYQADPSGAFFGWKATAIGQDFVNAKTFLEKRFSDDMELEDAIHTALLTMREGFEGEMTEHNIEIGIIDESRKFRVLTPAEVRDYLDETE
mmetsp:Transcript_11293/g.22019  ORF Transcript_11293/g.22019 Transcript_11293/m.22019 type:complete len:236 (-) Transcript_11293:226-933(-)|eukprot:CAMPEP_0171496194 /NCGR_PEP_ID=MMETSP0958-20121227/6563_1 /TAXON_ID=87120 /ORGANISM="Aurantiochytrium limacinum, Strain ATCCMYA-1381" /LENGTH=235 /DNA_ID=CAMNT_0012030263 /DNA_START=133 /DNA_END=840 /DNA_ORIENTATION=-